jgi:hypothetical protein
MATTDLLATLIPVGAVAVSVISAIVAMGRGKLKLGQLMIDFDRSAASDIRERLEDKGHDAGFRQYALLREYHAQGLAQSRVSFWFSLTFASIGFAVIALGVGIVLQREEPSGESMLQTIAGAGKPALTIISGTIIDAVAALFFVQSNKARQLMTEFFDKLRTDRKLDEALRLADAITDPNISGRLKALLALHFVDVKVDPPMLQEVTGSPHLATSAADASVVRNS